LKSDIPRGLYVVTDRVLCGRSGIVAGVAAALAGGAAIVQDRDKTGDLARRECEAERLAQLSGESGALFIVNDDVDLALSCGADGVHLGREDTGIAEARSLLGPDRLIGVSCYDSIERAHEAAAAGCDYVAFGSAYPSPTKPDASEIPLPVVAIGGITPENSPPLIAAGCHALAVISGVFGQDDPRAAAARYTRLFTGPAQAIR
jgi:thiamine-phosphate pyrophosphorylase